MEWRPTSARTPSSCRKGWVEKSENSHPNSICDALIGLDFDVHNSSLSHKFWARVRQSSRTVLKIHRPQKTMLAAHGSSEKMKYTDE